MSELSPSGGSERYGVCDDEGRGLPGAPDLPLGGRWPAGPDEGASVCHVLGGHAGPPLRAATGRNFRRGGPMWPPAKPSPHRGEGGPQGRMRGRTSEAGIPPAL